MSVSISFYEKQCTAIAGLSYLTWQLSRRGYLVSSDRAKNRVSTKLRIVSPDYPSGLRIQSRAFSAVNAVSLGSKITSIEDLDFDVMAITINAKTDAPSCFLLTRKEVLTFKERDPHGGKYWLEPRCYRKEKFLDRWNLITTE